MKLLKQMIERKLENARILQKNGQITLSYQERISAYYLALSYLFSKDKEIRKKENYWNQYIKTLDRQHYLKLLKYSSKEELVIFNTIKQMDIEEENKVYMGNSLFRDFCWAIISYEHEEAS